MKADMCGAAAMIAAYESLLSLVEDPCNKDSLGSKPFRLVVACGIVENALGGGSFRPDYTI